MNRDAGQKRGRHIITGSCGHVCHTLYRAALTATCHNPAIRMFYPRLRGAGKLKQVARVACLRKPLILRNAMVRDSAPFNPDHLVA